MRKRFFGLVAAVLALAALGWTLQRFGFGREREWTTQSDEALAAFNAGLDARMRLYESDAAKNFRRALEIDPSFVAAKVQLASVSGYSSQRAKLLEEVGAADLSRLTKRERFLVELALAAGEPVKQKEIVARELQLLPQDPWVLSVAAAQAWESQDASAASSLYRRLLEIDPNWISAHNVLGYMAMSQERFEEAEEHFRTYAYIAPDQANPHDSLGELLALRGRYQEAREELELALVQKPDFCSSYITGVGVSIFEGDPQPVPALLERAAKNCEPKLVRDLECESRLLLAYLEADPDRPWREGFVECAGKPGDRGVLVHRLALLSGRRDEALAEERPVGDGNAPPGGMEAKAKGRRFEIDRRHMAGVRALVEGHADEAVANFRAADDLSAYWGAAEGRFKLFNLMHLALALERANDPKGSTRALDSVRKVNPQFADRYRRIVSDLEGSS